jgi:hypothetical protein
MYETEAAKAIYGYTYAFEIRQLYAPIITDDYILHVPASIN